MLRNSALVVSVALVLAIPAGAALATTDDYEGQTTATTCPQYEERLELRQAAGLPDCPFAEDGVGVATMAQQRLQLRDQAECTGDGTHAPDGAAHGHGPGDGSGPLEHGPMDGTGNRFGHADR